MKPLIGITASDYQDKAYYMTKSAYIHAIVLSGGIPILLPYTSDFEQCKDIVCKLDGLMLPGGVDVSPLIYREEPLPQVTMSIQTLDLYEIELIKEARKQQKPILAICRGMQILNVALGGTLYQDIHVQKAASLCHNQSLNIRSEKTHSVSLLPNRTLLQIYGQEKILVNSYHHQAVKDLAPALIASAYSSDQILEACESSDGNIIAVQWHPEALVDTDIQTQKLFEYFIKQCLK
jgi:putative glutamine amidotransferase